MNKRKLLVITEGNLYQVTSRVRAINYFEVLKQNFNLIWIPRTPLEKRNTLIEKLLFAIKKQMLWLFLITNIIFRRFDVVLIQRLFLPAWLLGILQSKNCVVYYDFDDAVYRYSQQAFDTMIKYADRVIVSTPYLVDYIAPYKKPCQLIYSPVDTELIRPTQTPNEKFTIGWIGSPWTIHYIKNIVPVFQTLAAKIPFKLLVMGAEIQIPDVDVELVPWSLTSEVEMLKRIDAGIMPLFDEGWANMKGGYKLFLYMAAGRPVIASPNGINSQIVRDGFNGYLADTPEKWLAAFEKLYGDKGLRKELGQNSRKLAEDYYSYKVCSVKLVDFLQLQK